MPKRWGINTRIWAYRYLLIRDGETCQLCSKKPTTQYGLDIDHINGNPKDNNPDNLRLLCRKCNVTLGNINRPSGDKRERERKEGNPSTRILKIACDYRQGSAEMKANLSFEIPFRRWVLNAVTKNEGYGKKEAINEGAECCGCSPITTKRYLDKLLSNSGPLRIEQDLLGNDILYLRQDLMEGSR